MAADYSHLKTRIQGWLFEKVVRYLLRLNDYTIISLDSLAGKAEKYYRDRGKGLEIRGRGEWHQIDAAGQFQFIPPFVYQIRLLSEAKCYRQTAVGLPIVRGFVGALKDISENYFTDVDDPGNNDYNLRFTDCGAIFSTSGFSDEAENYAFAHGIKLISYKNLPIMRDITECIFNFVDSLESFLPHIAKREPELRREICNILQGSGFNDMRDHSSLPPQLNQHILKLRDILFEIKFSAVGLAAGGFPVHLVGTQEFPRKAVAERDQVECHIYHEQGNPFHVRLVDRVWSAYFSVPEVMMSKFLANREMMVEFKGRSLSFIDIPIKINGMRRIIRLELDPKWLEQVRKTAKDRQSRKQRGASDKG
ncbi:MAG: hypothetical protein AB1426_06225 [Bacillota bacterium]